MRGTMKLTGIGKRYRRPHPDRARTLREAIMHGFRSPPAEEVWGLRDVNFSIASGRTVGVVGRNGAGKSSLLRLIGGVGRPDEGKMEIHGRIGAVLDIGSGLTDELTGRENVVLGGVIAGMTRAEVRAKFDRIVSFAELENEIDNPLRTYSTGMKMRLAFSVAIHIDPDILLIDEVLAVGDSAFQRKCLERIGEIRTQGRTIFFVSHDASLVRGLCDDVLYLKSGRVVAFGPTGEVMPLYEASSHSGEGRVHESQTEPVRLPGGEILQANVNRFGTFAAIIEEVRLLDPGGCEITTLMAGGALTVEFDFRTILPVDNMIATVAIQLPDGTSCFDTNTRLAEIELPDEGAGTVSLLIKRLDLAGGDYVVVVGLYEKSWNNVYDSHYNVYHISVVGWGTANGYLNPPAQWKISTRD